MDSDTDDVEHMLIIHLYEKYMTVLSACLLDLPGNDWKYDLYWKEPFYEYYVLYILIPIEYVLYVVCLYSILDKYVILL